MSRWGPLDGPAAESIEAWKEAFIWHPGLWHRSEEDQKDMDMRRMLKCQPQMTQKPEKHLRRIDHVRFVMRWYARRFTRTTEASRSALELGVRKVSTYLQLWVITAALLVACHLALVGAEARLTTPSASALRDPRRLEGVYLRPRLDADPRLAGAGGAAGRRRAWQRRRGRLVSLARLHRRGSGQGEEDGEGEDGGEELHGDRGRWALDSKTSDSSWVRLTRTLLAD